MNDIDKLWVEIHFKENSIPSVHAGPLTEKSKNDLYNLLVEAVMGAIGKDEPESWNANQDYFTKQRRLENRQRNYVRAEYRTQTKEVLNQLFNIDGSEK